MNGIKNRPFQRIPRSKSGVALLTVLAFLSIFAVIMVGFTFSLRMEELTSQNYSESMNIEEASEAAIQAVLSQVARDLDPTRSKYVLGRPQPEYISNLDPWFTGYAGRVGGRVVYDARRYQVDIRPESVLPRFGLQALPTPIPLGVDEDPQGDVTGSRRINPPSQPLAGVRGDGFPGLALIDDDLDGLVDNDGEFPNDDDEDFREDEDGPDPRRPDRGGQFTFPAGWGHDADGDRMGVYDESAKININFAGNNFDNGDYTYNLGVTPAELDLELYLFNRVVQYLNSNGGVSTLSANDAQQVAQAIVNFRYGSSTDGGRSFRLPGIQQVDDNGNNDPEIVDVVELSQAFRTASFEREPFAIVPNGIDDDNDGLLGDEDEMYISSTTENNSGTPLNGAIGNDNAEEFRPGDKIDNDGDGYIDERNEGIDDPSEFDVFKPRGDDRPFATIDDLKLVEPMTGAEPELRPGGPVLPSMFGILRDSVTIYSQSDEISGPLSGARNQVAKINPNLSTNWRPTDVWDLSDPDSRRVDFQYSPPVRVEDLLPIQFDNDGDFQLEAEPDVREGQGDGIDNDGDGLVDEPSDDWDGNLYPSVDFDQYAEPEVGTFALQNGVDDDNDGFTQDEPGSGDRSPVRRMRQLGEDDRPRDEQENQIRPGMVAEGDGADNDGDNLVDDTGDFNGDGVTTYDPEWHVNEDAEGDLSADGYPGIGTDPEAESDSAEGDIVRRPRVNHDLLVTNFADDDWDGYADFYDPQVLAAMYAPEMDGVDNDNDGEVDEIGERYIAAYDDDEDGRMDEDPPEYQLILNMVDFIDTWGPFKPARDEDLRQALGVSDDDAVLSDPVTFRTFELFTTRQRAFRMHPRILAGPNAQGLDEQRFVEEMRFLLPNPPQTGVKVRYEGVEAIRINEVMPKPLIRLEAEEALGSIVYTPGNPPNQRVEIENGNFDIGSGAGDNGQRPGNPAYDSSWGMPTPPLQDSLIQEPQPSFVYLPDGFRHTTNLFAPMINPDALAPAFIFSVTNVAPPPQTSTSNIGRGEEEAEWVFENLPAGLYDVAVFLHPNHEYRPEVVYEFNGKVISLKSDTAFGDVGQFVGPAANPAAQNQIQRDTPTVKVGGSEQFAPLPYRLTAFPLPDQFRVNDRGQRVEIGQDGVLTVRILAPDPREGDAYYETSLDRIELFNPRVQYVELVNLSTDDVDLSGWQVDTPYGHYILPEESVIGRMKPSFEDDNGRNLVANEGMPGDGVPYENLLTPEKIRSGNITSADRDLEDNKLLLAFDKQALIEFIEDNYPEVSELEERVVEPEIATIEREQIIDSVRAGAAAVLRPDAQISDLRFKVVDVQDDILTNNPEDKHVTLYDPAGNYVDSFKYRTTFNNAVVDIAGNNAPVDIVALPGYRGFESFERADPTHFTTEMFVNGTGELEGKRAVPSSIYLDASQARLANVVFESDGDAERTAVGGYLDGADPNNTGVPRFKDAASEPAGDSQWNGWDFIGDWYVYPEERQGNDMPARGGSSLVYEQLNAIAREAVAPADDGLRSRFYQMLGGFENMTDFFVPPSAPIQTMSRAEYDEEVRQARANAPVTAFVWRLGVRELIRAGYDPDVDDQLTVRVLGRKLKTRNGVNMVSVDLPVGEVLVEPIARVVDPGSPGEGTEENERNVFFEDGDRVPVFAKLRNGDTAFTIDLRSAFSSLTNDLRNTTQPEPQIEIAVLMRKTTRDHSPAFVSLTEDAPPSGFTAADRPDMNISGTQAIVAGADGFYSDLAAHVDDNYFFRGIELFGRGRAGDSDSADEVERRAYLAGTPGRDNTGYVPAYPRRRWHVNGSERDEFDIVDNTAYVKNGPLATLGEASRIFTGNKFETVNMPLIPQRLEDRAVDENRILGNARLGTRAAGNDPEARIELAQRERLDQWENQYNLIYDMITTAKNVVVPGLVNVNTAPRETLMALPAAPPIEPGRLDTLQNRHFFNAVVADFIIEGREPGGRDGYFGIHELDDDQPFTRFNNNQTKADTVADYKYYGVGREERAYNDFDDIRQRVFDPLNIRPQDIKEDQADLSDMYLSSIVSYADDGPYADLGSFLGQLTHLKRRERFSDFLRQMRDRTGDGKPDGIGDLRERLNAELSRELTPEDMEALMNRVSNLTTVRSRAFNIVSRGRIFNTDGNIVAQRKLETIYQR